ncbi:MAG TPA: hypothetical protein VGH38_27950, partial [Bryobacteraceae bacterium]
RRRTERLVTRVQEGVIAHAAGGEWKLLVYTNKVDRTEHLALMKGDLPGDGPVLVRMHAVDLVTDVLGSPLWSVLQGSMRMIAREGRGIVVLLRETAPDALSNRVRALASSPRPQQQLRDYGIGAQILVDLGVHDMVLLTNRHRTIVGLEGYGLNVVEERRIEEVPEG